MTQNDKPVEWLRILSLKYKATEDISRDKFDELIRKLSENVGHDIVGENNDFVFPLRIAKIDCMCALVLLGENPIRDAQFVILTKESDKPKDMSRLDPIHILIEELFIIGTS